MRRSLPSLPRPATSTGAHRRASGRVAAAALAAALLLPPTGAPAQVVPDSVLARDTLRVRVTRDPLGFGRLPAAVSVLDGQTLRARRSGADPGDVLRGVPGLLVADRHAPSLGPRVVLRGFGARAAFGVRGIRVLLDDIPLTMPDGQSDLSILDPGSAGRVEVLRGPAAALYGNAAGGVLAVQTERPPPGGLSAALSLSAGDRGRGLDDATNLRRAHLKLGGHGAGWGWLASGWEQRERGFREHGSAERRGLTAVGRRALVGGVLSLTLHALDAPVAQAPGALPRDTAWTRPEAAWPNNVRTRSGESASQLQAGGAWRGPVGAGRGEAAAWALGRTVESALPFAWIDLTRRGGGGRAAWGTGGTRADITVGMEAEAQRDERVERPNEEGSPGSQILRDQVDRVTTVAPFARGRLALGPRLEASAGLRWDRIRFTTRDAHLGDGRDDSGGRTFHALSPSAALAVELGSSGSGWLSFTTAFQTPTTTELINAPPATGEPCCPGGFNTALEPQRAVGVEAGWRHGGNPALELVAYHSTVTDAPVPFQVEAAPGREFYRSAGEVRHRGVEAAAVLVRGRWTARLAYTLGNFVFVDDGLPNADFEGNRLPGAPRHRLETDVSVAMGHGLTAQVETEHAAGLYADDANEASVPALTLVDLRASWQVRMGTRALRPWLAVRNATDRHHIGSVVVNGFGGRYYEPAPGRHLEAGVTLAVGAW